MDDGDDSLELFRGQLASAGLPSVCYGPVYGTQLSPLAQVDVGLFADQIGVPAPDALDLGQGVHDVLLAIDVGVEDTKDELEVRLLPRDER